MKTIKKYFISLVFVLMTAYGNARELKIIEAPEFYQLYARDKTDSAIVSISGIIEETINPENFYLKVYKDGRTYDRKECKIKENRFSVSSRIHSGLHEFRFELYMQKNGQDSLCFVADSVVCGDAFIITGQSNSHPSSSLSTYSSPYCRSFGVKTGYEPYNEDDKEVGWGRATGNCPGLNGIGGWFHKIKHGVGVWGMELMRLITEKYQIPVCIINGGSGSSSIEENMLYPEIPSLETSFGRLAYRTTQAGLKDQVKAILWHQGETDSDQRYSAYQANFEVLFNDWKRVYPGLQKVYLFQLHPGCGGDYQSELKEIQNKIAGRYGMVNIMSTNGVSGHDGCHFTHEGYLEFAHRIFPLLARDFYGEINENSITPPKLIGAYYSSTLNNNESEITLEFDQDIFLEESRQINGKIRYLKDQFFFRKYSDDTLTYGIVTAVRCEDKKIVLILKANVPYHFITYLPGKYYINTNDIYKGPWIFGKNGIGALSFDRREITQLALLAKKTGQTWSGYDMLDSTLNGINFKVVFPKIPNKNRDWIWRARFWGHEPQTDIALLEHGFHVAYVEVGGLFGSEQAIEIWNDFYTHMTSEYLLNPKVVLEGMSRGGLILYNWANRNAEKVACIYADAPVCDFKSWPGGKGSGTGSEPDWKICLEQHQLTEEEALTFKGNPIDHMENIAKAKVPILHVVGDKDSAVPVSENTDKLEKQLNNLGWEMKVIHKPTTGHHPHSLPDPKPMVDFILMNTGNLPKQVYSKPQWSMNNVTTRSDFRNCIIQFEEKETGHVAFIGGSITEMNGYRPMISKYLQEKFPETDFSFTNAGISSTCSTTGAFRLERDVLSKGPLDLLFIEFAVNDDQDAAYSKEEAILGMEAIIRKARKHNPFVDLVITYFVNPDILNDYQNGRERTSIASHEAVAQYYNISTCNLAKEVADQITIGTLDWDTFGGTHPNAYGNTLCKNMIVDMLEEAWEKKEEFPMPDPMRSNNFEQGRLVDPEKSNYDKKWVLALPDWKRLKGTIRPRFIKTPILSTEKKGAELTLEFTGIAIGVFILAGPDAGIAEVSIDGGTFVSHDLYHKYSQSLHYPRTIMFANNLNRGEHTLKLRMSERTSSKGNAMRIMNFVVNEWEDCLRPDKTKYIK